MRVRLKRKDGAVTMERVVVAGLVGLAVGLVAGRWLARVQTSDAVESPELEEPDERWADRWGERMDAAVEAGARGLRGIRRRWGGLPPVDLARAVGLLAGIEGADGVRIHDLGGGIVELVGEAPAGVDRQAVAALDEVSGVRVVVNRIWSWHDTPAN